MRAEGRVLVRGASSLPFSTSRPRLFSICARARSRISAVEVAQDDGVAVLREDLGDAVAHRPAAEDGDRERRHPG